MEQKFEQWAIVELLGHNKIAGLCTEQSIAGTNMLRVDVPDTETQPSFTKFFSGSSIYAINPVSEDVVRYTANNLQKKPIESWDIKQVIAKMQLPSGRATTYDEDVLEMEMRQEDEWMRE
jgi:hypothetical protein